MALGLNQLRKGLTILINNQVYFILSHQHVKPGKGHAFARVKLRNIKTGAVVAKTFRGEEKIEEAFVEQKKIEYLYKAQDTYHFMDINTYEEIAIEKDKLDEAVDFLKDNLQLSASFYEDQILDISLPATVEFKVIRTEAGIRGDTVKAGSKPAVIETGAKIVVPLFINQGDTIKVDTRSRAYLGRVS